VDLVSRCGVGGGGREGGGGGGGGGEGAAANCNGIVWKLETGSKDAQCAVFDW